jgi:outer membrane lipoprotein carrier protein
MRVSGIILLLCSLFSSAASAAEPRAALQRFLDGVQTLQAEFTQTQSDERGQVMQTSGGQMWLARGERGAQGRFRWDYQTPYAQQIVCDGERIWLYDPDLAQVTVRPAREALSGTPAAALLAQGAELASSFTLEDAGSEGRVQKLRLLPKAADSEFRRIELWLDGEQPVLLRFEDPLGGSTEIRFSGLQINERIRNAQFEFKPPKGVEVVGADGSR